MVAPQYNFFTKINVTSTSFASHLVSWNFNSIGFSFLNEADARAVVVEYSFDGTTVHGDLTPLLPSEGIVFDNRMVSKVWFRLVTAGTPALVRVEAWK